jgi:hypothetical protein
VAVRRGHRCLADQQAGRSSDGAERKPTATLSGLMRADVAHRRSASCFIRQVLRDFMMRPKEQVFPPASGPHAASRLRRRRRSIWVVVWGLGIFIVTGAVHGDVAAQNVQRSSARAAVSAPGGRTHRTVSPARLMTRSSVDAGDSYPTPSGRRYLRRLSGAIAIQGSIGARRRPEREAEAEWLALTGPDGALRDYRETARLRNGLRILR